MKYSNLPRLFTKIITVLFLIIFSNYAIAQFISVDTNNNDADHLLNNFLGTSKGCITVSNAKITGWDKSGDFSYGYFDKNSSTFDIDQGIILSTGKAKLAEGPKKAVQSFTGSGWNGDDDLSNEIGEGTTDATALEFDFISHSSDKISFEYIFLSEEYYPKNCRFSDGLAFFIKKVGTADPYVNFAHIPGTNKPVTVPNVNSTCPTGDPTYFGGFIGYYDAVNSPTNFYGQTKIMTATSDVEVGVVYHIKIVIADEGNYQYDSAIFLKAGSFVGNKNLGPDLSLENGTALCTSGSYVIDATPDPILQGTSKMYTWYKDGVQVVSGNIPKYTVLYQDPGLYEVEIDLDSGCKLKGHLKVEQQILPIIGTTVFNGVCDDDLDGNAEAILNSYTQQIISNLSQDYGFDIKYFDKLPSNINNPIETPINKLEFSSPSKDAYIWIKPGSCSPTLAKITFIRNALSSFDNTVSTVPFDICDDKLENKKIIDLSSPDYMNDLIPLGYDGKLDFYKSRKGANNKDSKEYLRDTNITLDQKNPKQSYFVRFHQPGLCDNVAEVKFNFKQPKKSTILKDTIVCKGSLINLDAGTGFDPSIGYGFSKYKWSTGETSQIVTGKRAGDYWVDLEFNGCVYRQSVKITEPADLIIDNVLIEGNKITILASNGIPSYRYFLDGNENLTSNIFENVSKGKHTVEVKDKCGSVLQTFYIINEKNVITPNDDGFNDIIDYSDLLTKLEPRFEVYDRNGVLVFKGTPENQYKWNGKLNGRALPTSSYWYVLEWNETGNPKRVQNTGWILLKNRN